MTVAQPPPPPPPPSDAAVELPREEVFAVDTPRVTSAGNAFLVPAGWSLSTRGRATVLEVPERGSFIAIIDVTAREPADAVAQAWAAYDPKHKRELYSVVDGADIDGWTRRKGFNYRTAPSEKRVVSADTFFANETWTVVIYDMDGAVAQKRQSQETLFFEQLKPKGFVLETHAGKRAHVFDAARIAVLEAWIEDARAKLEVPGVALGIVQDGKVVVARGFGVRDVKTKAKVDAKTKFVIASMTKALTTLMLAKLVEENRMTWETPVVSLMPGFALGDAATTAAIRVKHLICACTGMPRRDQEFRLEYSTLTAAKLMTMLGTMQPTSKFGELFQYSNYLGAAAGFVGGFVAYPKLELGAAYDKVMQTRVFTPLGMRDTTFDLKKARVGNSSRAYGHDHADKIVEVQASHMDGLWPVRPTGGAVSTVEDMLRYVQLELDGGMLDGKQLVAKEHLLARSEPQIPLSKHVFYGMGLIIDRNKGVRVISHGGNAYGHYTQMVWLPEHRVGAVLMVNSDAGQIMRDLFPGKFVELLFDGRSEVDGSLAALNARRLEGRAKRKENLKVPADPEHARKLADRYTHPTLGDIVVRRKGTATVFDVGEWQSEVGSWKYVDGSVGFISLAPGLGIGVVPGVKDGKRTLVLREAQNEYVFVEK